MELIQVATTTETRADAERIARALLERRLAACVQIHGPIQSHYWWQGKIESAEEWGCVAKTKREMFASVSEMIRANHTYAVPEIVATPVVAVSASYLQWAAGELSSAEPE